MKKYILSTLLFCIIVTISISQTKNKKKPNLKETQDWIIEKIETYSNCDGMNNSISFQGNEMIVKHINRLSSSTTIKMYYYVPLKSINSVQIVNNKSYYWIILRCKKDVKIPIRYNENGSIEDYADDVEIILLNTIENENMKNRLKSAFLRLFELYGNPIKKEAF
jgi:hypothetical protein